eukprot:gene25910-34503_t
MKFGKSISRVVELSDPEWGPYWINYKFLKKKINDIVNARGGVKISDPSLVSRPSFISKSSCEVDFFKLLKSEMKKFYKDALLLENFAIMNYCGFSKILKKHDKLTGFATREAFMRNVMSQQNFTHYTYVLDLIKDSEKLYAKIQKMESVMPLQDEERLFLEAIRDLNHQVGKLQEEERDDTKSVVSDGSTKLSSPEGFDTAATATDTAVAPVEGKDGCDGAVQKSAKLDTGELVNAAAAYAMEAAMKLHSNVNSSLYPSATSLHSVVSWANEASSTAPMKKTAIIIAADASCVPPISGSNENDTATEEDSKPVSIVSDETQLDRNFIKNKKRPLSVVE